MPQARNSMNMSVCTDNGGVVEDTSETGDTDGALDADMDHKIAESRTPLLGSQEAIEMSHTRNTDTDKCTRFDKTNSNGNTNGDISDHKSPLLGTGDLPEKEPIADECPHFSSKSSLSNGNKVKVVENQSKQTSNKQPLARATSCYDNAPDGGWGWVVTFSAFMVGVILDGISFSFGLFFKELLLHFGSGRSLTSWVISVLNGTYLGIGPIASVLVSAFGTRQVAIFGASLAALAFFACTWSPNVPVMILLYGLLGGTGLGLLYLPAIVTVGHYFKKKRALATGIAVCGSGIGGFIFPPLCEFLIEKYTWKGAMWIISAIVLNGIPIAVLLRPLEGSQPGNKRQECANGNAGAKAAEGKKCCDMSNVFDFELLKSPTFLVYGCSCFLCMLGFYIPFTYIPDLAEETFGMTSQQAAMLISIIGILNTGARVLVGWVADRTWADALLINSVALVIGGVATMFVPMYATFPIMATYSVVFGIAIAVFVSLRSILMAELLGIEKLRSSFGLVTMCQGLSAFIGAPIAGRLYDVFDNYEGAFYLAGTAIALSGMICFPLRRISRWENSRSAGPPPIGSFLDVQIDV